jgi:hypothetical protein
MWRLTEVKIHIYACHETIQNARERPWRGVVVFLTGADGSVSPIRVKHEAPAGPLTFENPFFR